MIKTGIVITIMNGKAGIMTSGGEFVYIKANKLAPKIGEVHTGQLCRKNSFLYKYAITAASLIFILISSTLAHAYYTTVTTIVFDINPSVSLEANRWDKIISFKALNSAGSLILNNIKIKNKSIDNGLELLLKEAKIKNFINDKYVTDKKIINIHIKGNEGRTIDVSNFKKAIDSNNLNFKINASSNNNKKIKIIANNKKVNTAELIPSNNKKKTNNKKSNNKSNSIEKPSVDIKTNIIENKSFENKKEIKKNINSTINKKIKMHEDVKLEDKNTNVNNEHDKKSKNPSACNKNFKKPGNPSDKRIKDSND